MESTITTLNVRGEQNASKRKQVFQWLKSLRIQYTNYKKLIVLIIQVHFGNRIGMEYLFVPRFFEEEGGI
jgi:hypothetical protein